MKKLKSLVSIALLCLLPTLSAYECCPTTNCFSCLEFSLFADYLYWNVCRQNQDLISFQTNTGQPLDLSLLSLPKEYTSGYRVGGSVQSGCLDLAVRYTSYKNDIHLEVVGGSSTFSSDYDVEYSVVDIDIGYQMQFDCVCGYLMPFIGAKLAWIDESIFSRISTESIQFNRVKGKYTGYGLTLGAEAEIELFNCCIPISFVTRGSLSLLEGSSEGEGAAANGTTADVTYVNSCSLNMVPNLYVALDFGMPECGCINANLQLGYETQLWTNWTSFQGDVATSNPRTIGALGFSGLVVRLAVGF